MPSASASVSVSALPWIVYLVGVNIIGILACVAFLHFGARRRKRQIALINAVILDYFRRSGVMVAVNSVSLTNNKRFTAFVESEPMKRFRLSHIIEMTLREHIAKVCGLELEKIYWRFPIREVAQNDSPAENAANRKPSKSSDEYINEGLVNYRDLPKVDVREISWEKFEEVTTQGPDITSEAKSTASASDKH